MVSAPLLHAFLWCASASSAGAALSGMVVPLHAKPNEYKAAHRPLGASPGKLTPDATWALLAWSEGTDKTSKATMVDIDLFDQHDKIGDLKKDGHIVICYYSAGTAEDWRPDVKANKKAWQDVVVGKMKSWDEAWLDITQLSKLSKLMEKRIDLAQKYGCDGVEPDNTDCYDNDDCYKKITPTISRDKAKEYQIKYNEWTANYVHSKGMLVALKNTGDLVSKLHKVYDFSIAEQCLEFDECDKYADFHADNKAVFGIEYKKLGSSDCSKAKKEHVQMKYCEGHDDQECKEKTTIHDCWASEADGLNVIV